MLFLDEPTSGLDTATAVSVIGSIRDLARDSNGKLGVLLSIHQPNNDLLALFDHVLLLSRGQPVFFGSLGQAERYFSSLGFSPTAGETPTNYYLQLTASAEESSGSRRVCSGIADPSHTNFVAEYLGSAQNTAVRHTVCSSAITCVIPTMETTLKRYVNGSLLVVGEMTACPDMQGFSLCCTQHNLLKHEHIRTAPSGRSSAR
jgi:ABC-type multidrug transport system ATPase subunit